MDRCGFAPGMRLVGDPELCDSSGDRSRLLLLAYLFGCNLRELVCARFSDQDGHFVICRLPAMVLFEFFNGRVTLRTALAISFQQFIRHTANFKT